MNLTAFNTSQLNAGQMLNYVLTNCYVQGSYLGRLFLLNLFVFSFSACSFKQVDYSNYRSHMPKSILVLPPLNETTSINAEYKFLPTISTIIGEQGYYVFPLALVDHIFKENGVITPIEMRQVSRDKLIEIFGADSVLDIRIKSWGTKYYIIASHTEVVIEYELIDLGSGLTLWSGYADVNDNQNNNSNNAGGFLLGALVHAIISNITEPEAGLAIQANHIALTGSKGLLNGPRLPEQR